MSKRPRIEEETCRRIKPIPTAVKSEVDTCFFFVKLLNGKTITADLPLDTSAEELVKHLVSKQHLCSSSEFLMYLVVGRRCASWTQTLRESGVTRDCTVSVLCRLPSTKQPEIWMTQELLGKLAAQMDASESEAQRELTVEQATSKLDYLMGLSAQEVADNVEPLQTVLQLCTAIAQHPRASANEMSTATQWLAEFALLAQTRVKHSSQLLGCQQRQASAVAGLLELWLMAVGAHSMVTLYSTKEQPAVQEDSGLLDGSLAPLQLLASWLDAPPAVPLPDCPMATSPGLLFGGQVDWTSSGQSCLVQLMAACDWEDLQATAALMQCITLMAADHALSSYQHQFKDMPGLCDDSLTHSKARKSLPRRVAAAGQTADLPVQLQLLAHASQLLDPVLNNTGTGAALARFAAVQAAKSHYAKLLNTSRDRWHVLAGQAARALKACGWTAHHPAGALALQTAEAVAFSATVRRDPSATAVAAPADIADMNITSLFIRTWRPVWHVLPLLREVFARLEGFMQFAAAARLPVQSGSSPKAFMPACLARPQGLLPLLEAWYVMEQISGVKPDSEGFSDAVTAVSDMLLQLAPYDWLQHSLKKLRPRQVCLGPSRPGKAGDASPRGVAAALFDLLAWVPRLAGALSHEARSALLEKVLFPPPGDAPPDEEEDEDGFGGVHIVISRENLLQDSINEVRSWAPQDLRKRIRVEFAGEDAYGSGVIREWLVQLSAQLFDPAFGLFTSAASDLSVRHPNPPQDEAWNLHMKVAGRVVGLALRHRVPLGIRFSRSFYKLLTQAAALPAGTTASSLKALGPIEEADEKERREKRISGMGAWQRPHPWQAAAAAVACCRRAELLQGLNGLQLQLVQQQEALNRPDWCLVAQEVDDQDTVAQLVERAWRLPHTISDLHEIEPDMASSLKYLLDNDGAGNSLGLVWSAAAQQRAAGSLAGSSAAAAAAAAGEVELVPGGADVCVTEDNKAQYVTALLDHKLTEACKLPVLYFFAGLADVAEPAALALTRGRLLLPLDAATFNAALAGSPAPLGVQQWSQATTASGAMVMEHSDILTWFWEVVEGFDDCQRRQLLRFWTGFTHLPATGFEGLGQQLQLMPWDSHTGSRTDADQEQAETAAAADGAAPSNHTGASRASSSPAAAAAGVGSSAGSSSSASSSSGAQPCSKAPLLLLPRAHTCFMQLLLPTSYTDARQMRVALLLALQHVDYFGHQ